MEGGEARQLVQSPHTRIQICTLAVFPVTAVQFLNYIPAASRGRHEPWTRSVCLIDFQRK